MSELYDATFFNGRVYLDYDGYKYLHKGKAQFLARLGVTGNVLEIGCGYGYMVDELNLIDGIVATGIDVSSYAVSRSTSDVTELNIKALDFEIQDYDWIVSFNVLDNAQSDAEAQAVADILNGSSAKQIHIVIMPNFQNQDHYFHQIIMKDSDWWLSLYDNSNVRFVCFSCKNIYEKDVPSYVNYGSWLL